MQRIFILLGGLAGAAGVALAAQNAHPGTVVISSSSDLLQTASVFLMFHAAVLLAIGLNTTPGRILALGGGAIALGLVLFCGELTLHGVTGEARFAAAAPAGGVLLVLGWLVVAASALLRRA